MALIPAARRALPGIALIGLLMAPFQVQASDGQGSVDPAAAARRMASGAFEGVATGTEFGAWSQVGMASWYGGPRWHGHLTASGSRYDENALTAAHATLPIGTRVRVMAIETGNSVIVTINDRPSTRNRIIDLSRAAARSLGILSRGIARVSLSRMDA